MGKILFHIVWTTRGEFPIWDSRGDWTELADIYNTYTKSGITYSLSEPFEKSYKNIPPNPPGIPLTEKAQMHLRESIIELTGVNGDRVAGNLDVQFLHISETTVQLLVLADPLSLPQKIARLKSRTATLLSFKDSSLYPGKGVWGKGYWIATILNKEQLAISIIKNRIQNSGKSNQ